MAQGKFCSFDNFSKNFVPLIYNDMEYDCMADLIELDTLSVKSKILSTHGIHVNEGHPSTDFHKIMADSVIKKIEIEPTNKKSIRACSEIIRYLLCVAIFSDVLINLGIPNLKNC